MEQYESKESRSAHSLAVAVTLAILGVSVGVDVQKVWAQSFPGGAPSTKQPTIDRSAIKYDSKDEMRIKEGSVQQKLDATQQKLPSRQDKERITPDMRPSAPLRP